MASVNRYKAILKEVAADLEVEPDSELCTHVSTLRLMRENIQARLLRGERVDPDDVLKLDQALRQYLPERKAPSISVSFVEGVVGIYKCQHCGKQNDLKDGEYTPLKSRFDKSPQMIEGTATEVKPSPAPTDGNAAPSTAAAAKADIAKAKNTPDVPTPVERRNTKWVGEGDRAFMPAVNFVEGVEGWTKRPSVWPSRGNTPSPPPSQACQNKNHR
jgi:hypothetical protein